MKIGTNQKKRYIKEGYMIIPEFLNQNELELVRNICNQSIELIEKDTRSRNVTEERINVFGKKYFVKDVRKNFRK